MTFNLLTVRHYCQQYPDRTVDLTTQELLELIDRLQDATRQRDAVREHLERRHGCSGECGSP